MSITLSAVRLPPWLPLPLSLTPLVGREREVATIVDLLLRPETRLLTLTGPGGIGKTRVGLAVAARLSDDFADGVWFVPLAAITDPALVAPTIARALGVRDEIDRPVTEALRLHLRERELLLVLDNAEQVVIAAPLFSDLLGTCSLLKVLTTSRMPLRLSGEHEVPILPLALPDRSSLPPLPELARVEAVALFVQRAQASNSSFVLSDGNATIVTEICHRVDGLPLAIELAASRVKLLSPEALLARLTNRLTLLTGGARDAPARQRTLRNAIAWSHDLLSAKERVLFHRLAVFVGGFTLEAAENVGQSVLDTVESLTEQSLLQRTDRSDEEPRFAILETVREYALEQLAASGEEATTRQRHAIWFLTLVERAEPELWGAAQGPWLRQIESEYDNVRAALAWLTERGEAELCLRLAGPLVRFWCLRPGYMGEGRIWLEQALAGDTNVSPVTRARALVGAGAIAKDHEHYDLAVPWLTQGLALARACGDAFATKRALVNLGITARFQERYDEASAFLEEALALSTETADDRFASYALDNLGLVALRQGAIPLAIERHERALMLARTAGDVWGTANVLYRLGIATHRQGDSARATTLLLESLALWPEHGDRWTAAEAIGSLAAVATTRGEWVRAAWLLGAATALRTSVGVPVPADWRADQELLATTLLARLGSETFAATLNEGGTATPDEVMAAAATPHPGDLVAVASAVSVTGLTLRELDVLRLLAQGQSNQEIAETLFISRRTVTTHVTNIFAKLGFDSRTEAATYALRKGLA